jgi:uncharacterized protein YndB with AHSA1/START domain
LLAFGSSYCDYQKIWYHSRKITQHIIEVIMGHVSYSQQIAALPEQVWAILSDVRRLPDWAYKEGRFPHPVEGRYGGEQTEGVGTIWVGVSTDGQTATQKITAWDPPRTLGYELEAAENAPMQMTQTSLFSLEETDGQTNIIWTVEWEVGGGFSLNKLLIWFTGNSAFEEMIAGSLENLKALVESESPPAESDSPANSAG